MARHHKDEEKTGVDRWNADAAASSPRGKNGGRARNRRTRADRRRYLSTLFVLLVGMAVCVWGFTPLGDKITRGLDIEGGVSVIMTASKEDGSTPSGDEMATAVQIVQQRVNSLGAAETSVQQQGANSILGQIPGATDADAAVKTIGETGHLEFVRMDQIGDADALAKINAGTKWGAH